jgi:putative FmdB family regulatory protein
MPTYDVECSQCSFTTVEVIKLADIVAWDAGATCPHCASAKGEYRRVINQAPASFGGEKSSARSEASRKQGIKEAFVSSGERDAMMHRNAKHHSPEKIAAARESVKKGEFEGF